MIGVKKIVELNNYKIDLLFSNNELREVDFEKIFNSEQPDSIFLRLRNPEIFKQVKLDEDTETIFWDGQSYYIDYDGKRKAGLLDIAPELLFEKSILIKKLND